MELNKDGNRNAAQKLELKKDRGKKLINRWNQTKMGTDTAQQLELNKDKGKNRQLN